MEAGKQTYVKCGGKTEGDGHDGEGQTEDGKHAQIPGQFGRVAHLCQRGICGGVDGAMAAAGDRVLAHGKRWLSTRVAAAAIEEMVKRD